MPGGAARATAGAGAGAVSTSAAASSDAIIAVIWASSLAASAARALVGLEPVLLGASVVGPSTALRKNSQRCASKLVARFVTIS